MDLIVAVLVCGRFGCNSSDSPKNVHFEGSTTKTLFRVLKNRLPPKKMGVERAWLGSFLNFKPKVKSCYISYSCPKIGPSSPISPVPVYMPGEFQRQPIIINVEYI